MADTKKSFPDILKGLIHRKKIKQEKLAVDLDVSYSTIRSWLSGDRKPKTATIRYIEDLYGVKIL